MTLDEMRKDVGRLCSLLDSSGNFVDGLVLEADLTALINRRWKYLHLKFANKFPEAITIDLYADLVEDQASYAIDTDDIKDFDVTHVGIKYSSDDDYYTTVKPRGKRLIQKESTDLTGYQKTKPYYYFIPTPLGNGETHISSRSINIVPTPDADVTDGLMYSLVEMPADMELDADTPYTLPSIMHTLIIDFVVADVWQIKRDWQNSNEAMGRAGYNEKRFFDQYQPSSSDLPITIDVGKRFTPNLRN